MQDPIIITEITAKKISIPLVKPFVISLGPLYEAQSVFIKIETNIGITGFGECSPFMSIHGESADTAMVVAQYFRQILLGKNALNIEENITLMDFVIYANKSIKSAFDMALYDIASKNAGLPLYKFLGGNNDKEIATDFTVSVGEVAEMVRSALEIKENGFPVIKVKLGKDGVTDVERMKAIRNAVGSDIPIRIDANQGWQVEEAIEALQQMKELNIQHCEEPIARWNYMALPKIREASPIPIMADESCCDVNDAKRLYEIGACDLFNLKIGKSGGIFKALQLIKFAEEKNIGIQLGAFLESRLAMSAFAHLSLCSNSISYYDFDTALMFTEDPVNGGIVYKNFGVIEIPETPGIGAEPKFLF